MDSNGGEGVCFSSASILKRLTGMLVWLPLDWEFPLPLLGPGSGPEEEAPALVTQLEMWSHLGGGFCFLPPLHGYKKLFRKSSPWEGFRKKINYFSREKPKQGCTQVKADPKKFCSQIQFL